MPRLGAKRTRTETPAGPPGPGGMVAGSSYGAVVMTTVLGLVFPARCPGCGVAAEPMCEACGATTRPAPALAVPPGLDALVVPFAYEGVVRELVARAKYRNRHAALEWLAQEMTRALGSAAGTIDVVTWAPTTARRKRRRGFDQAELLATLIASELGLPIRARLKRVAGRAQTGENRAVRAEGPQFVPVRRREHVERHPAARRPESVLVADDVITTGATMRRAARELRNGGAERVVGVAAARKP